MPEPLPKASPKPGMDWFPIFIDLKSAPCLVVGGGAVAARKAAQLAGAGARARCCAPDWRRDPRDG